LHVLLFSDNVSLEDEIALKKFALGRGLLLMGPGAGTAIINGVGLGFANQVPRGEIGIVSAAGTGLQEVSTLLAKRGLGISQAIGMLPGPAYRKSVPCWRSVVWVFLKPSAQEVETSAKRSEG